MLPHSGSVVAGPHGGRPPAGVPAAAASSLGHWRGLQLYPSPVTNQGTIEAMQPKCSSLVAALFMLQSVLQSLQLYPSPVPNQGTIGALEEGRE